MAYSNIFKVWQNTTSRIWMIMSTTMVSYFVVLMCYVDSEAYFGVFQRRYTVFCIWIQFLIWNYVLKSYFVVITPKYDFLKVRQIRPKIIRRILKYEYDQPKYDSKIVKYAHICVEVLIAAGIRKPDMPSFQMGAVIFPGNCKADRSDIFIRFWKTYHLKVITNYKHFNQSMLSTTRIAKYLDWVKVLTRCLIWVSFSQ